MRWSEQDLGSLSECLQEMGSYGKGGRKDLDSGWGRPVVDDVGALGEGVGLEECHQILEGLLFGFLVLVIVHQSATHRHKEFPLRPWWWRSAPVSPRELHTREYHTIPYAQVYLATSLPKFNSTSSLPAVQPITWWHNDTQFLPSSKAEAPSLRPFETGRFKENKISYLGWVLCGNHCRPP